MKLSRIDRKASVAICVPCRDTMHSLFAQNLLQLVQYCNTVGINVRVLMQTGSIISGQRQKLARAALEQDSSHVLWLDSDMMFPPSVLETLLSHEKDIVACNYSTRSVPFKGVAYRKMGDWNSWLGYTITGDRLQQVEATGMGCMLVRSSVMKNLELPWFEITYSHEHRDHIGEDFYFCTKAIDAGHEVWIDTVLSREIKHLGTTMFDLTRTL